MTRASSNGHAKDAPRENHQSRTPPRDESTEKAFLGSVMLWPEKLDDAALVLSAHDFYFPKHGLIFQAMLDLWNERQKIDSVLVGEALVKRNQFAECGGANFLIECIESVPHGAHAEHYARIVAEKAQRRELILTGQDAISRGYDETTPIEDGVSETGGRLEKILERNAGNRVSSIKEVLFEMFNRMDGKRDPGLSTGFPEIDHILSGGMRPGAMYVLAARPSHGKTALAVNMAAHIAASGSAVGLFSLEQPQAELIDRLLSSQARLESAVLRGNPTEAQRDSIMQAASKIGEWPLIVDECESRAIAHLEASARLMQRREKVQLIVVDYLQLLNAPQRRDSREQEVAEVSRRLKGLAKSLRLPLLVLAQINRQAEAAKDHRPRMAHLRESGSIEADADVIMLLNRPEMFESTDRPGEADLFIDKNRNGPTGEVKLQFEKRFTLFQPLAPEYARSAPINFNSGSLYQDDGGFA